VGAGWHPDVSCYTINDAATGAPVGHFYLDLFSRDGKFGHQCVVPLVPSFVDAGGERVLPACAILGNLSKPTAALPSLLRFDEVKTFFHEFGHVMHCVCARVDHARHAWTWPMMPWPGGVEQDFLEVPSMMWEKFCYLPAVVARLSAHHALPGHPPLPADTVRRLAAARHHGAGLRWTRFVAMAEFDLVAHSAAGPPYVVGGGEAGQAGQAGQGQPAGARQCGTLRELAHALMARVAGRPQLPETFYPASWYHLVIGYDAGYYGYLWSEVYAQDCFDHFLAEAESGGAAAAGSFAGSKFAEQGLKFRKEILEPCASRGGMDMLKGFLGREPTSDAFFKELDI
jgi:thimet oligopeptidase